MAYAISIILLLLTVTLAIALLVGLFSPRRVLRGKDITRLNVIRVYGLSASAAFLVAIIAILQTVPAGTSPANTTAAAAAAAATKLSAGDDKENWAKLKGDKSLIADLDGKTLGWFSKQDKDDRDEDITPLLMAYYGTKPDEGPEYRNCIGDLAATKSAELKLVEVFGWCKAESDNNRTRFLEHINELDIPDRSVMAGIICNNIITEQLVSPASADFPFTPDAIIYKRHERYAIRTHVDSQNAYGALLRSNWFCDIQFNGAGEDADRRNWQVHAIEQQS